MNNSAKAISALIDSVIMIVSKYIDKAEFDVTKQGRIMQLSANGNYVVNMQGTELSVPSSIDTTLSVGDSVWILIPKNNLNDAFIIGKRNK